MKHKKQLLFWLSPQAFTEFFSTRVAGKLVFTAFSSTFCKAYFRLVSALLSSVLVFGILVFGYFDWIFKTWPYVTFVKQFLQNFTVLF